jgi:hypothetical protein
MGLKGEIIGQAINIQFSWSREFLGRLQWPRGLKHELSSLTRMMGSWVPMPLKA